MGFNLIEVYSMYLIKHSVFYVTCYQEHIELF
jgi:hypothetical protein